jgi:ATP-dependent helicase/nuclease subunit B
MQARFGAEPLILSEAVVYLPTRRAARGFAEDFARESGGAALLPEFRALNDVDEDELLFDPTAEVLDLPPAIAPLRRTLLMATLIRRWNQNRDGGSLSFVQSVGLAGALAKVMDEVEIAGADLSHLDALAPAALAAHWAAVKDFLSLIRTEWPKLLAAEGALNPGDRRNRALAAVAERIGALKDRPVIAAGSTGSIPATAGLMAAIVALPKGAVVLPGLDRDLDAQSWERLDPGHPQYGLKQLLSRLGVERRDVADWTETPANPRRKLLSETLRPAPTTDAWRALAEAGADDIAAGLEGLSLIETADPAEEAGVIALALRETLETPGKTAALVTRDRALARRVAAQCRRFGLEIDDSAGRPLSHTPVGGFLCLMAEAAQSAFAPVPLLALLKHPLAAMGDRAGFRRMARRLDLALRGPRPDPGLGGVAAAVADDDELAGWFAQVAAALEPFAAALGPPEIALSETLAAHIGAAEALAGDLWRGGGGPEANAFAAEMALAGAGLPAVEPAGYSALFRMLMDGVSVRPPYGSHPRLFILGPLEARLQAFDRTVLGGLNEGSWPAAAPADPWFSRPMRRTLGLEQPERAIGLAAHDFAVLAGAGEVFLTRAGKSEGAPTVASRFVQRLVQLARGLGLEAHLAPAAPYRDIFRALNDPGTPTPIVPPAPAPPVSARPRALSVTEIETWLRDPYAIYARRVLGLRALDPLDAEIGPLERGSILHRALELFVRRFPHELPADAALQLVAIADEVFAEERTPKAVAALWRPRFVRAAFWFVEWERRRRAGIAESFVEVAGKMTIGAPGGDFTLSGKADRIDRLKAGGAVLLDYKTGAPPSAAQVAAYLAPQLPLEGAILSAGGFFSVGALAPAELAYVRISGGDPPGEVRPIDADARKLAAEALARLARRVGEFDDPHTAYESRVAPLFARGAGDYDHLARLGEWSASGWGAQT